MYPNGIFGLDGLRLLLTPITIFGITFFVLYLRNEGVRAGRSIVLLLAIAFMALVGAKLFSLHTRGWELYEPIRHELSGGLRYPGALLAMIVFGPILQRLVLPGLPMARFLDVLAITVCFCFALTRISCFINGCCTGGQCEAGYCLSYAQGSQAWYVQWKEGLVPAAHDSHPVLPLHFLFMAASFLVGVFLMWFDSRRSFDGQLALLYLFLHDGAKGLLESLREPYVVELQVTSLTISAVGLLALIVVTTMKRKSRSNAAHG